MENKISYPSGYFVYNHYSNFYHFLTLRCHINSTPDKFEFFNYQLLYLNCYRELSFVKLCQGV